MYALKFMLKFAKCICWQGNQYVYCIFLFELTVCSVPTLQVS